VITILPEHAGRFRPATPALKRLHGFIRRLPWDGANAWLSFSLDGTKPDAPDLLLVDPERRASLLSAADLREPEADDFLQPGLFAPDPLLSEKLAALRSTILTLTEFAADTAPLELLRVLVFPSLPQARAREVAHRLEAPPHLHVLGAEEFAAALSALPSAPLSAHAFDSLRARFSPECEVPAAFLPRLAPRPSDDGRSARLTPYLLDFPQESWVKNDLLVDEAAGAAASSRSRLITGVAGSGKSLALLYRARILAGLADGKHFLFTTHNKPLIAELRWRFEHLGEALPSAPRVKPTFSHFYQWAHRQDPSDRTVIPDQERITRLRQLVTELFPDTELPRGFFIDEIAYLADQIDDSLEAYLALDRVGRGVALDASMRRRVHALYQRYRQSLAAGGQTDWYFKLRILWERIASGKVNLPRYDYIIVDEAQFFAPLWFALLKKCLLPDGGEFLIAADPTQGFLKRRQSWRSLGLEVRGRVTRLERSYRNQPALQAFARRFYLSRLPDSGTEPDAEDISLPGDNLPPFETGGPELILHRGPQDSIAYFASEIAEAIKGGLKPEAILVLHEDGRQLHSLHAAVGARIGSNHVRFLDHDESARGAVAFTTLGRATGIERPIVFLAGLDTYFEQENDPRLDPRERSDQRRDHTRKIYMALTRAGEKLIISHLREETGRILRGDTP
jgi:hypothetical protein